jgi:hypothetical protein
MAIAEKPFLPWARAETIAERSAQIVNPNDRFSMLAPVTTDPSSHSKAAPTRNPEYGEYDFVAA